MPKLSDFKTSLKMTMSARLFRVVLGSDTSLRLMEKAGDQPNIWRFPYTSGEARMVTVRDIVQVEQGLPRHIGFEYSVDLEAPDIDEAAAAAQRWAETVAFMMSSATRAPVGRLHLQLAYEITPDIDERDFRQWFWDPPIPVSKPSVNRAAFGEVRERVDELATADSPKGSCGARSCL